jgi:predicted DNA binding CopG/RHH family protein
MADAFRASNRPTAHRTCHDRRLEASVSQEARKITVKRKSKTPNFRSDQQAADFWATHDSARYASDLKEKSVAVDPALRRRVAETASAKKPVTLRLENQQIIRAKELARRKSVPYQTLMRMWIAEGLAKESSKTA